jgi:hypothetical protein
LRADFQGAESVTVELRTGSPDPMQQVSPKLRGIAGVGSVEMLGQHNGSSRFMLHVEKGVDVRESVFRMAVVEGWIILEMQRKATTLEEVFHKLTTS